ncbi:DNA translocase FtsK [Calycomorphotria hydatis]|nr:DNA translocase FtsK [Calycomorphotria hydatis]
MILDLAALGLLVGAVFLGLSLATYDPADPPSTMIFPAREMVANVCGPAGAYAAYFSFVSCGYGAYLVLLHMAVLDLQLFSRGRITDQWLQFFGKSLTLVGVCAALQMVIPGYGNLTHLGSGGYIGAMTTATLTSMFSSLGSEILVLAITAAGLVMSGDAVTLSQVAKKILSPFAAVLRVFNVFRWLRLPSLSITGLFPKRYRQADVDGSEEEFEAVEVEEESEESELETDDRDAPDKVHREIRVNPPVFGQRKAAAVRESAEEDSSHELVEFDLPDVELLEHPEDFPYEELAAKARESADILEQTFEEFGLNVTVSEIDTGPVVTQFELNLEKGLRVNKVTALADDLAIALRVPAVRIVSPIPGKNTVGVEVPNDTQVMVRLRELIESMPEDAEKYRIPLFLGKDVSGHPLVVDMTKMPHLLIAGRTGTGKSVCLNTLILSMLFTRTPDEVKMLMIDPKMVELSPYKRLPHLMHPVITDMKKAEAILSWAVDKMEERYDLLARCGVRHLDNYNKLSRQERLERMGISELHEEADSLPDKMPYIVIVADEMADMMMTSGKDVEGHIIRLAQKSRAVGIHLVLATQKPTVDVITGLIKSNLPARISFQVASRTDSRVVLDEMGAERLLGCGDMLYLTPGTSNLVRAQGTYVSNEEMESVIDFFADIEPQYSEELKNITTAESAGPANADEIRKKDELYEQAIDIVVREGRGSTSLLQRAMGIGYGRAARLIDYMAEDGIVGEYNGSQAREVMYTVEQWEAVKSGGELVEA